MGINVFPAPTGAGGGGDSWELVTSTTPSGAVTQVTFSNLSGYKSYRVVSSLSGSTINLSTRQSLRINNDSNYKYGWAKLEYWNYHWVPVVSQDAQWVNTVTGTTIFTIDVSIECANLNAPKPINGFSISGANNAYLFRGIYSGTSPVTSITFLSDLNSNTTVYLYGIPE